MLTDALPDGLDNKLNLILTLFPDSLVVKSLLATLTKIPGLSLSWLVIEIGAISEGNKT